MVSDLFMYLTGGKQEVEVTWIPGAFLPRTGREAQSVDALAGRDRVGPIPESCAVRGTKDRCELCAGLVVDLEASRVHAAGSQRVNCDIGSVQVVSGSASGVSRGEPASIKSCSASTTAGVLVAMVQPELTRAAQPITPGICWTFFPTSDPMVPLLVTARVLNALPGTMVSTPPRRSCTFLPRPRSRTELHSNSRPRADP